MLDTLRQRLITDGKIELTIRVRPHAKVTRLKDILDDGSLKIDLAAAAEDNKANIALMRFLADAFSVPASHIALLSGATSRLKLVRITSGNDR